MALSVPRRVGLGFMMLCTLLPIALSATDSRLVVVVGTAFACLSLLLASGLAWMGCRPGRQAQGRALQKKHEADGVPARLLDRLPAQA